VRDTGRARSDRRPRVRETTTREDGSGAQPIGSDYATDRISAKFSTGDK
jgi:hypothetical protein